MEPFGQVFLWGQNQMFIVKKCASSFGWSNAAVRGFSGFTAFAAASVPALALAQSANPTAPTRDQVEPPVTAPEDPAPQLKVDGDIERAPCALADPSFADVKITMSEASFANLDPVSPEELRPAYAPFLGKEQPISILCEVRDAAATMLRNKGYLAAVQVPVQRIENGAVRFEVVYARVTTIRVLGEAGRNARVLERYLSRIATGKPFNRLEAERDLLLARDIPGYDIRLSLRPAGTGAGEMVGEVRVSSTPVLADFNIQNFAGRETGRIGGQARVQFNGLLSSGDRTTLSVYSTANFDEQQVYQAGYDMLLGSRGLRVGGRVTYAITRPTIEPGRPDIFGRTFFATLDASYPFKRSQALSLTGAAGIELVEQKLSFSGTPFSQDQLRALFVKLEADTIDLKGLGPSGTVLYRAKGSLQLRRGISILSASRDCSSPSPICSSPSYVPLSANGSDPTPTLIRGSAEIELRPSTRFTVQFAGRGQYSAQRVPAFEQFSTGNYTIGRGFDPGALVGDSGVGAQVELRIDPLRVMKNKALAVQPYAFTDTAWTWNRGNGNANRLTSVGAGLRTFLPGRMRLDVTAAFPTNRILGETKRRDMRLLASLTTVLLPWRTR
jgi:hemolysin activation/secretion protein